MKDKDDDRFKTHIKEPRWQQVVSILIVLAVLAVEGFVLLHH